MVTSKPRRYEQTVTLTNNSAKSSPVRPRRLDNLSENMTVLNPGDATELIAPLDSPYVSVKTNLGPGRVAVRLRFQNPVDGVVTYTPPFWSGQVRDNGRWCQSRREGVAWSLTMPFDTGDSLASLLARADAGDARARDALFATLYDELHRLAEAQLRRSAGPITLGATTLVHEAYLKVSKHEQLSFPDRNRFFGYAARAMRGLILNYVRDRRAQKRGGELTFTSLDDKDVAAAVPAEDLEALGRALDELAALEPVLAELVELRFFCGFSFAEIATIRGVSERTAQRDWSKARALLYTFLGGTDLTEV